MNKAKELTTESVLSFLKGRDYSKTDYLETEHPEKNDSQLENLRWELKELYLQMNKY